MKPRARLDKWASFLLGDSPRFAGVVSGHPKLPTGEKIFTSEVLDVKMDGERPVQIETRNTVYELGDYSEETAKDLRVVEEIGDSLKRFVN